MIDDKIAEKAHALRLAGSVSFQEMRAMAGGVHREVLTEICEKGWFVGTFITAVDDQVTGQGSMGLVKSLVLEGDNLVVHGNGKLWGYDESFTHTISLADHGTRLLEGDETNPWSDVYEGQVKIIGTSSNGHTASGPLSSNVLSS